MKVLVIAVKSTGAYSPCLARDGVGSRAIYHRETNSTRALDDIPLSLSLSSGVYASSKCSHFYPVGTPLPKDSFFQPLLALLL